MGGSRNTLSPVKLLSRRWLYRILGIALVPAAIAETGCSAPSFAVNRQRGVDIELVAMPSRGSLLGEGIFARKNSSSQPMTRAMGNSGGQFSPTPESEERLLAIARLFTAQGRTQDAQRIYQQLGRSPEQESSGMMANRPARPNMQETTTVPERASNRPVAGKTNASPAISGAASPAITPKSSTDDGATVNKPSADHLSATKESPQPSVKPPVNSSVTTVSSATPRVLPPVATGIARVPAVTETSGWQNSGESSSLPTGPEYTISTGISGLPRPWSPPGEERASGDRKPSQDTPSSPGASFKLPVRHGQSDEWNATLQVVPGKFLEPSIRPGNPGSSRTGKPAAESFAAPDRTALPSQRLTSALEPAATPQENQEQEQNATPTDAAQTSLLIIPNGAGAAEKIAGIRKAARSGSVVNRKRPSIPASSPAEMLLSGPYRDMHTPKVLEAVKLLDDADPKRRSDGARQLGLAGPEARTVLPLLRDRLATEKEKLVQARIAEAIVKIVPDDADAIHALTQLLSDPVDWQTRQAAAAGLAAATHGSNTDAVSKLVGALNDGHPRVRAMVALTLGAFGPKAKEALPRLQFAATTDIPRVQEAAQAAIACISPEVGSTEAAADFADGATVPDKVAVNQKPALLPAGDECHEPENDAGAWLDGMKDEQPAEEDDADPFSGTLFDFDAPASGTVQ